jgi:hypothetical protein
MTTTPAKATLEQRKIRTRINEKYGNRCASCGFSDPRALHIDHVASGGQKEMRGGGGGLAYYYRVLKDQTGKYQLLCANCNAIKRFENKEAQGALQHRQPARLRRSLQIEGQPELRVKGQ